MKLKWTTDAGAESTMRRLGITDFKVKTVPFKDIDLEAGRQTQARLAEPINDELVESYALAMERGDAFPMAVCWEQKPNNYVPMGGNNRLGAAELMAPEEVDIYVFRCTDKQKTDLLPRVLNRVIGLRTDNGEALTQAMYAMRTYDLAVTDAADMFGIKPTALIEEQRIQKVADTLAQVGIDASKLAKQVKRKLNRLADALPVLKSTAGLIIKSRMSAADASVLVDEVKDERSEAGRLALLASKAKDLGVDGNRVMVAAKQGRAPRTLFLASISNVRRFTRDQRMTLAKLGITDEEEITDVRTKLQETVNEITQFLQRSEPRKKRS